MEYTDDIFSIWEHGEESLKIFIEQVDMVHSKIQFTAEYLKEEVIVFRRKYKINRWVT